MSPLDAHTIARDVVIGTRHWSELGGLGVTVTRTSAGLTIQEPAGYEGVDVSLSEVAQGLVAYRDSPEDLQVWALIVRTLANVDEAVETPERQELLDLLWDLSFGAELQPAQLDMKFPRFSFLACREDSRQAFGCPEKRGNFRA